MEASLRRYFSDLNPSQINKLSSLEALYADWNNKINLISRKDFNNFNIHHLLHSLSLAKVIEFSKGSRIIDIGTGGGFPGIPLAIMFPESEFTLVDSIRKKTVVVKAISETLELENIEVVCERAENINKRFDFIVSRAVTSFPRFVSWTKNMILPRQINTLKNGILYLKGGKLSEELAGYSGKVKIYRLSKYFTESFFEEKKIVYLPF